MCSHTLNLVGEKFKFSSRYTFQVLYIPSTIHSKYYPNLDAIASVLSTVVSVKGLFLLKDSMVHNPLNAARLIVFTS